MAVIRWLGAVPFIGILGGAIWANRVQPLVAGMPFLLAWLVLWLVLTSLVMAVVYFCDPANRRPGPDRESQR